MKNYIIIHGSMGHSKENWFPWLEEYLNSNGFNVYNMDYPTPEGQNYLSWSKVLDTIKDKITNETIFIGHSIAPIFIVHYCIDNNLEIAKLISVAGANNFKTGNIDFDSINESMFLSDVTKFKSLCKDKVCYYSTNDPYIPLQKLKDFAKSIEAKTYEFNTAGHFNEAAGYTTFEDILKEI